MFRVKMSVSWVLFASNLHNYILNLRIWSRTNRMDVERLSILLDIQPSATQYWPTWVNISLTVIKHMITISSMVAKRSNASFEG